MNCYVDKIPHSYSCNRAHSPFLFSLSLHRYNQCRKIAFVPFPFPHDQILVFNSFLSILLFPVIYVYFVNDLVLACILNFVTFLCFKGIHEVSRELTNPFYTVPNDIPLNNLHAQFNEALVTMYAGFHPDSWRENRGN